MFNLSSLVRKNISALKAYSSARDEFTGVAEVLLDANENSLGSVASGKFNRYPDPHQRELKNRLAEINSIAAENIFVGNGSDEAIDLLIRAFCEPRQDEILVFCPTYGMYEVWAQINDVSICKINLSAEFEIDLQAAKKSITSATKLIFICSPNNPSGNLVSRETVVEICRGFDGLVVLDEAYIDFAATGSLVAELQEIPNLVILQTFSKAWGMAGLRVGMAYADSQIIAIMEKIKSPYNVNLLSQQHALEALTRIERKTEYVAQLVAQRKQLSDALAKLATVVKIYPSEANFLLIETTAAREIYQHLLSQGIVIRDRSSLPGCEQCLRVTVGTVEENRMLIEAWSGYEKSNIS